MPIQLVKNIHELEKYESDWDRLATNPAMAFHWMKSWWQAFGANHELHVLVVSNDQGIVIGIAPWYISKKPGTRTLKFLGSGKVCSDYLQILTQPNDQIVVESALFDHIEKATTRVAAVSIFRGIELEGIQADKSQMIGLLSRFTEKGYQVLDKPLENAWQIALPDTWENLLATLYSSFRRKIKKCVERIDSGVLQVRNAETESDWQQAYSVLSELHQARRKSIHSDGCFDDARFCKFLHGAIPAMMKKSQARVVWLTADNKPIAACLLLLGQSYIGMYQSGIDPDSMSFEPGHTLAGFLIRDAIRNKVATYDYMRGNEPYKALWRAKPIGLTKCFLVPPTLGARSAHGLESFARRAVQRIRKAAQSTQLQPPEVEQHAQAAT
jgi:CelD/BcsL family acetyltransferase involved in cellulose biosynthesis